jgi:hypothetical protein
MICQTCREEGKKSTIEEGLCFSTLVHCSPYFDTNGVRHHHDSNTLTREYECSNGHRWRQVNPPPPCPAPDCDFGLGLEPKVYGLGPKKSFK